MRHARQHGLPVSIKDIARRAGVAPSTVSRALNGSPWIARQTRARIAELAQEMRYIPNAVARSLVAARSGTVGVCLSGLAVATVALQAAGIDLGATRRGYRLLLAVFHDDEQQEHHCVRDFQERRMEGIVVVGPVAPLRYLEARGGYFTPIVVVDQSRLFDQERTESVEHHRSHRDRYLSAGREAFELLYWLIEGGQPADGPLLIPQEASLSR